MKILKLTAAIATLSLITGCASIVGDKEETVTIKSSPKDANITITDERSEEIYSGNTPTTVQLQKSDGSYFGGKTYSVKLTKDGYKPHTTQIGSSPSGWYIGGNIVFGGLIGWLIVDPLTGAMYNLSPDTINASLGESIATTAKGNSEIKFVMIEDVPSHMRDDMQYIGNI